MTTILEIVIFGTSFSQIVNEKWDVFCYIVIAILVIINYIKKVLKEKCINQVWLADKPFKRYDKVNGYVQNRQQPYLQVQFEIAKLHNIDPKELIQSDHEPKRKTTTHHKT